MCIILPIHILYGVNICQRNLLQQNHQLTNSRSIIIEKVNFFYMKVLISKTGDQCKHQALSYINLYHMFTMTTTRPVCLMTQLSINTASSTKTTLSPKATQATSGT